jgi:hypothetical protein
VKRISTIATAALVALALSAAVGAASASALPTVLCKSPVASGSKCPSSEVLPAGSWLAYKTTTFTLKNSFVNFACTNGGIGAESQAESGDPLSMKGEVAIWNCRQGSNPLCSEVNVSKNASTVTNFGLGSIFTSWKIGSASEPLKISFTCQFSGLQVECTFAATGSINMNTEYHSSEEWDEVRVSNASMVKTGGNAYCLTGEAAKLTIRGESVSGHNYVAPAP